MKCLILCMGCNNPFYQKEWEDVKATWAKDILDGKYPNLDIIMYTSSETNEYAYDKNEHILYVSANDSRVGAFEKTSKAIQALNMFNIQYDCILRINCSTIINIKLLNEFINSDILDLNKIYIGKFYKDETCAAPFKDSPVYIGNGLLISRFYANLINSTSIEMVKQVLDYTRIISKDLFLYDNLIICAIFNTFLFANNVNPYDVYQVLPTQYLHNVYYNNENLYGNNIAFFIKKFDETRPIKEYYNESKLILEDFYSKYYNLLSNDLDNLRSDLNELRKL